MSNKLGRNEKCPCGSGKKYKYCCLGKRDVVRLVEPPDLMSVYSNALKKSRFKECLYPDKSKCTKVRRAHSLQRAKILENIAEEGDVVVPEYLSTSKIEVGIKKATTFQGFCQYHDKTIFQPIEDGCFDKSDYHVFLHIYRTLAYSYHKKREGINATKILIDDKNFRGDKDLLQKGLLYDQLFVRNLKKEKSIFDRAILNKNYSILKSFVWEFPNIINFAACGIETPKYDFTGLNLIQNIHDSKVFAKHIYYIIFPWEGKTYSIIAWLAINDSLFGKIKKQLTMISETEKINFLNNTIPIMTDNIAIRPSSWDKLPDYEKDFFFFLKYNGIEIIEEEGYLFNRFLPAQYNFFKL